MKKTKQRKAGVPNACEWVWKAPCTGTRVQQWPKERGRARPPARPPALPHGWAGVGQRGPLCSGLLDASPWASPPPWAPASHRGLPEPCRPGFPDSRSGGTAQESPHVLSTCGYWFSSNRGPLPDKELPLGPAFIPGDPLLPCPAGRAQLRTVRTERAGTRHSALHRGHPRTGLCLLAQPDTSHGPCRGLGG